MTAVARVTRGASNGLIAVLVGTASALALIAIARLWSQTSAVAFAAVCVGVPVGGWLLVTKRHGAALALVAVYVGLVDGYVRLKTGYPRLTLVRDLVLYLVVAGACVRLALHKGRIDVPPWTAWIVAFVGVTLVQLLNPANPSFGTSLQGLRPHLEWVPLFFFGYAVMRSPRRLRVFFMVLLVIATINGIVGYVQLSLSLDQLASWGPGYADITYGDGRFLNAGRVYYDAAGGAHVRPLGLGPDTGFGGRVGFLAIAGALALLIVVRRARVRAALLLLTGGTAVAIIGSQQRTVVLAAVVALFAVALMGTLGGRGLRVVAALAVATLVGYGAAQVIASSSATDPFARYSTVTPQRLLGSTAKNRGTSLGAIPGYLTETPFGVGLGRSGPASGLLDGKPGTASDANSETQFNYMLSELGVPGLLVFFGFSLLVIAASLRVVRRLQDQETRLLVAAVAAPLVAILVISVATSTSATTPLSPYLWFASGVIAYWWRQTIATQQPRSATT